MHGSLHRRQSLGTTTGDYPPCKRVPIHTEFADPLCCGMLIEPNFQDGVSEFRLGSAKFTPDHQAIGTVKKATNCAGIYRLTKPDGVPVKVTAFGM